ncbi:1,4-alpha-glucan branching enzyme [Sphingomonas spermidinifaciens]|uniref:1,4-alpha-glucan branching enzyme GlgB n=1 Tax=Sphingomonas spermidinifaciens TaxID=1141889 RepID=A0A2A4B6B3_9SPHN|nr:1,4-alpha-glucan branching protein GlgB [Sphingomonas spermidinifaciens]PCD03492.1 1,4-alpha-glucan branching enzyme [Sphingomonas spermidinifaciens]
MGQAGSSSLHWLRDPFAFLGRHDGMVRVFQPGAERVTLIAGGAESDLQAEGSEGLFTGPAPAGDYRVRTQWPGGGSSEAADPYAFAPQLGDLDLHLLREGSHWDLALRLGANIDAVDGVEGTRFAVWAPNAQSVSVVGDFCSWDTRRLPMRLRHDGGIWELFVPGVGAGARYKYAVLGADGVLREKADPLARATEHPPATASIVAPPPDFAWTDAAWMADRGERQHPGAPISIYELHAGSWRRPWHGGEHDWDALADQLIPYLTDMGFSHVELMPIAEHPFGGSWGYQPLSPFAPSARYGDAVGFARFVDRCHAADIGVILDWVPAHFPSDAHGFARFDGTALYEHEDPREGFHPDWNTLIFNLGRREVAGMLIASALWWLEHFHVDGLRVDAVASMLYRDYSRREGEWVPNVHGGRENLESIDFLRRMNAMVRERCPGAITIAEESTAFPGVTAAPEHGGLGFTFKWNMGWMNDTLRYMEEDPINRRWHHGLMTFGPVYAFSEKFILPLSHDEVVHGKGSLIAKMPGDPWQKFANLRAYLAFMWAHPGKKLLFMGGEIAQWHEWHHDGQIDWAALGDPNHAGVQALVRDLNALYRAEGSLHQSDADERGFAWAVGDDAENSVFAFHRRSAYGASPLLCVVNLTPVPRHSYRIGVEAGTWDVVLNSDDPCYAGSGLETASSAEAQPVPAHGHPHSVELVLPPLATLVLRHQGA